MVELRVCGDADEVREVVGAIRDALDAGEPSREYPNRRGGGVRVYLRVGPRGAGRGGCPSRATRA